MPSAPAELGCDFLVMVELPAVGFRQHLKWTVKRSNLERISGVVADTLADLAQELDNDLILRDRDESELMTDHLRKIALSQLASWEVKLTEAAEIKVKGERSVLHLKTMREAYFKELNMYKEQVHLKTKAEAEKKEFEPNHTTYFDPTEYVADDELSTLLKQKVTLMEHEHKLKSRELHEKIASLTEQIKAKAFFLNAKDELLTHVKEKAAEERSRTSDLDPRRTRPEWSRENTAEAMQDGMDPRLSSESQAAQAMLAGLAPREKRMRSLVTSVGMNTTVFEMRDCSSQCDVDGSLIEKAIQLFEKQTEESWKMLVNGEDEDGTDSDSDSESKSSTSNDGCTGGTGEAAGVPIALKASEAQRTYHGTVCCADNKEIRVSVVQLSEDRGQMSVDGAAPVECAIQREGVSVAFTTSTLTLSGEVTEDGSIVGHAALAPDGESVGEFTLREQAKDVKSRPVMFSESSFGSTACERDSSKATQLQAETSDAATQVEEAFFKPEEPKFEEPQPRPFASFELHEGTSAKHMSISQILGRRTGKLNGINPGAGGCEAAAIAARRPSRSLTGVIRKKPSEDFESDQSEPADSPRHSFDGRQSFDGKRSSTPLLNKLPITDPRSIGAAPQSARQTPKGARGAGRVSVGGSTTHENLPSLERRTSLPTTTIGGLHIAGNLPPTDDPAGGEKVTKPKTVLDRPKTSMNVVDMGLSGTGPVWADDCPERPSFSAVNQRRPQTVNDEGHGPRRSSRCRTTTIIHVDSGRSTPGVGQLGGAAEAAAAQHFHDKNGNNLGGHEPSERASSKLSQGDQPPSRPARKADRSKSTVGNVHTNGVNLHDDCAVTMRIASAGGVAVFGSKKSSHHEQLLPPLPHHG
mmetsp:Transcript_82270/g.217023  ORF Transcript_82270/g.217023 Transcript_82270/m.217023 type:complete len:866 (+) Transcript_82270:143-2740(+)|eukprot:CAMPEP_0204020234 /NCGR_PEP_ID=MMETSP0360-20130528/29287_1 /ASSEMBLY_ACC=CAM_ASM_000342 /TAXON_ID=268821 /ORGANISM="Scrippsiella Hangoei, Strain SHTV-5" /LENGTH=865 /DNA_ID=CAMNT_0050963529 /DNA_START=80 /DNA_END=2677 /DNA_ORIENTATION=+